MIVAEIVERNATPPKLNSEQKVCTKTKTLPI